MARRTKGLIFARGGWWCAQYYVDRHEHKHRLLDDDGKPVPLRWKSSEERKAHGGKTPLEVAQAALEKIISPLRLKERQIILRNIAADLQTIEEKIKAHQAREKAAQAVEGGLWKAYAAIRYPNYVSETPPANGRAYLVRAYCNDFAGWLAKKGVKDYNAVSGDLTAQWFAEGSCPAASMNDRLRALKMVFKRLCERGRISFPGGENPFAAIQPRKEERHRKKALDRKQLRALFAAAGTDEEMRTFLMLGYYCGLRRADCATLQWDEIHDGLIVREQAKLKARARDIDAATVRVGIPPAMATQLKKIPQQIAGDVLPTIANQHRHNPSWLAKRVRKIFAKAGMKNERHNSDGTLIVDYGFHSLRHTYVSDCVAAGVPLAAVQKQAGHHSAAMTEHYVHVNDEQAKKYAALLRKI